MQHILLNGGLGNQMFQYAFYLSLKNKGHRCIIDNSMFSYVKMHSGYELEKVFGIKEDMCSSSLFHRMEVKLLYKYKPTCLVFSDKPFEYCGDAYGSSCWYYIGVWINPSYFAGIESELKKAFCFVSVNDMNMKFSEELRSIEAVSLHIRRGDYLNNPIYNICTEDYYKKAIDKVLGIVNEPVFIVFSDDADWCKSYLKQFKVNYKIVDWNRGKDSFQDMFLMSQCKHNVIANSTFSWWGAWLNQNKDKVVIAPSEWTTKSSMNYTLPNWSFINLK